MTQGDEWLDGLKVKFTARLVLEREALRAAERAGNREVLIDRAHKLAGIAGMLGAHAVGEAALTLEQALLVGSDHRAALAALILAIDAAR